MLTKLEMSFEPPDDSFFDSCMESDKGLVEYCVFMQSREVALKQSTKEVYAQVWSQVSESNYTQIDDQIKGVLLAALGEG